MELNYSINCTVGLWDYFILILIWINYARDAKDVELQTCILIILIYISAFWFMACSVKDKRKSLLMYLRVIGEQNEDLYRNRSLAYIKYFNSGCCKMLCAVTLHRRGSVLKWLSNRKNKNDFFVQFSLKKVSITLNQNEFISYKSYSGCKTIPLTCDHPTHTLVCHSSLSFCRCC